MSVHQVFYVFQVKNPRTGKLSSVSKADEFPLSVILLEVGKYLRALQQRSISREKSEFSLSYGKTVETEVKYCCCKFMYFTVKNKKQVNI